MYPIRAKPGQVKCNRPANRFLPGGVYRMSYISYLKRYCEEMDWLLWMRRIVSAKSLATGRIVALGFS